MSLIIHIDRFVKNYCIMIKLNFIVRVLFLIATLATYGQDVQWERTYGGKHAEYLFDAIPTPDYGFILVGSSVSGKNGNKDERNKGDLDYWVWKMKRMEILIGKNHMEETR